MEIAHQTQSAENVGSVTDRIQQIQVDRSLESHAMASAQRRTSSPRLQQNSRPPGSGAPTARAQGSQEQENMQGSRADMMRRNQRSRFRGFCMSVAKVLLEKNKNVKNEEKQTTKKKQKKKVNRNWD